ncbi:hypothetical protein GUJ93_ZPchr0012g21345 [Zizania palustris]|uniref:Late embryogenesis abundant protein LEA-2 subgroup domain-containing protein n=1 Tax=Zizania palustris TaxID=103762 RepID=A0A8J6BU93_ZIZPA|nr:hypothetical protein GUJ93_ZPchr0012g21345 [Zizania palustris]
MYVGGDRIINIIADRSTPYMAGNEKTCLRFVCTFVLSAGFIVLIYWATFQPRHIQATVGSAALSNLTVSNLTVSYRLNVNVTMINPSGRVGVHYDALYARLSLRDDDGGSAFLGPAKVISPEAFYQPRRSDNLVTVVFDGMTGVAVASDVATEVAREIKAAAAVGFELAVDARVRYKFGFVMVRAKPRTRCSLRIPVKPERRRRRGVDGVLSPGHRCIVKY